MRLKRILCTLLAASLLVVMGGCSNSDEKESGLMQFRDPDEGQKIATMKTSMGDIKIMLFEDIAPKAVQNFVSLSETGYYDGVIFHRVINDFMIQGGDPEGTGMGGESMWGKPFEDEFSKEVWNFRGALSMANSGKNTNGSQFFIVQASAVEEDMLKQMEGVFPEEVIAKYKEVGGTPWLDGVHTVFGQVIEGMDVVDQIAQVEIDSQAKPKEDVVIESITIEEYKAGGASSAQ